MNKKHYTSIFFIFITSFAVILFIIGCSGGGGPSFPFPTSSSSTSPSPSPTSSLSPSPSPSEAPPEVKSVIPSNGADNAEPTGDVEIVFSERMDTNSVNGTNVRVTDSKGDVTGIVSYDENTMTATFKPSERLSLLESYSVKVSANVKDISGNNMTSDFTSSFTVRDGTWGTPQRIENQPGNEMLAPQLGVDSSGNIIVVWYEHNNTRDNVWSNRYIPETGWGTEELIEENDAESARYPEIAVDPSGNAIAGWIQRSNNFESFWANRYVVGEGWGTAELIETEDGGHASDFKVAIDPSGNAIVVLSMNDGTRFNIWANRYVKDVGWGTAEQIEADDNEYTGAVSVDVDPSGNAIAVWHHHDGVRYNIWANRYVVGSGWGTAEVIETENLGDAQYPDIAVDQSGNALAVWQQADGIRNNVWSNRYTVGSGWQTAEKIELNDLGDAYHPDIKFDPFGNAITVWYQYDGLKNCIYSNRYFMDSGWSTRTKIDISDIGYSSRPKIAVDNLGNAVAVWEQHDGFNKYIWANRYSFEKGWGTGQLIETGNSGDAQSAQVVIDDKGRATVVWRQYDGIIADIWTNSFK